MRRSTLSSCGLLVVGCLLVMAGQRQLTPEENGIAHQLSGPFEIRFEALKRIANSDQLRSDPVIRRMVIGNLRQATSDPDWNALDEGEEYEDYYGQALETVQKIATEYNDTSASKALVSANYNDDSDFAKRLAAEPKALPALLDASRDLSPKADAVATNTLYVLAEALARCQSSPTQDATCVPVEQKRREILTLLRQALSNPNRSLSGIRGLGLCGEQRDIDAVGRAVPSPNSDSMQAREARLSFVHEAQQQIRDRLAAKEAPLVPPRYQPH